MFVSVTTVALAALALAAVSFVAAVGLGFVLWSVHRRQKQQMLQMQGGAYDLSDIVVTMPVDLERSGREQSGKTPSEPILSASAAASFTSKQIEASDDNSEHYEHSVTPSAFVLSSQTSVSVSIGEGMTFSGSEDNAPQEMSQPQRNLGGGGELAIWPTPYPKPVLPPRSVVQYVPIALRGNHYAPQPVTVNHGAGECASYSSTRRTTHVVLGDSSQVSPPVKRFKLMGQ